MGIDKFNTWICQHYHKAIDHKPNRIYDHIYIDANCIYHTSLPSSNKHSSLCEKISKNLDYILMTYRASKSITIVSDGSAPYAKMIQQRLRRSKMTLPDDGKLTGMHLTPSTYTMNHIDKYIRKVYIAHIRKQYTLHDINITYCGSDTPGEGELKITKCINDNQSLLDTHLVVSNDADAIVMSCVSKAKYISILIKNTQMWRIISINTFCNERVKDLTNGLKNIACYYHKLNICINSIMQGNDYLPKIAYNSHSKSTVVQKQLITINKYREYCKVINGRVVLCKSTMCAFLSLIVNAGSKTNYIKNKQPDSIYRSYVEGLLWCVDMYKTGVCHCIDWMHINQKAISPVGLLLFLSNYSEDFINPISYTKPIPSKLCPHILLPHAALSLLSNDDKAKMLDNFSMLYTEELCITCKTLTIMMTSLRSLISTKKKDLSYLKKNEGDVEAVSALSASIKKSNREMNVLIKMHHDHRLYIHKDDQLSIDVINNIRLLYIKIDA